MIEHENGNFSCLAKQRQLVLVYFSICCISVCFQVCIETYISSYHQRSINTAVRATLSQILGDLTLQLRHRQENTVSHVSWRSFIKHKHMSIISYYAALWNMLMWLVKGGIFSARVVLIWDFSYVSRMVWMNWCYKSVWLCFYRVLMERNVAYLSSSAKVRESISRENMFTVTRQRQRFQHDSSLKLWCIIFHNHFHSSTSI